MDIRIKNKLKPTKGCFLLAEPFLQEDHFHRSVIFLCDHSEEGTFGFVLNKFLEVIPTDLTKQLPDKNLKIGIGGPVDENNLFFLHQSPDLIEGSLKIGENLSLGGDFEQVVDLINTGVILENQVLFFLGYSGWSTGQLQEEIEKNSWLVVDSDKTAEHIFSFNENLWKDLMKEQGKKYEIMSNFPDNHLWN